MKQTLKRFTTDTLFDATSALLSKLNIEFDRETAEPISVADLYDTAMPKYLTDALECIDNTYFIGIVNDGSLQGEKSAKTLSAVAETMEHGGKYDGMFIFACDAKKDANFTRTAASALTRAFNRIASANPVILVIRQGKSLSLATCERMEYSQTWRQGSGEKLGKVTILRNINCDEPHRGHVDILTSLGSKTFDTFEELYKNWIEVFSSELLTKKFYCELSDWYAWAVMVAKFPNDIRTDEDDAKFNHESCIRLITRLIFVWFLKQKKLIPEEFFDERYIHEHFIENFDPHDKQNLLYDAGQSKYYRLILQNLFFAMLNCPIVAEGKTTPNNRRFRGDGQFGFKRDGYNVNNLMRYKSEFAEGGADKFVKLANRSVPFLNGGLFDCLDDKPRGLYYDGFSERRESLEQLFFPDYLFFGEEVGNGIDLSQWYDDKKKKNVSARGIIDILKRYSFTIEENTPYDQEVSLDPELLGKVFENLLAAYNPETKQSARKQTGSFYTPREIVQYMVDESLVAHLKRMCGDDQEDKYRQLLNYASDDVELTDEQRKNIMSAVYNCRVLDPACGSGAFPMGVLQQMVHVLKRIDPSNKMWESMMVDIAIEEAKKELQKVTSTNDAERAKIEENRKARLEDIENAFNQSINDPDYARKLYLIEHCIYGVDIQPIATQISKLRFFISLVVDQKPTNDAKNNFGIRPLPNLEAKFVTANTLIPLDRSRDLFTNSDEIRYYEDLLRELNHRIYLAKRNKDKENLRLRILDTQRNMAQYMENEGIITKNGFSQVVGWNMFDQNSSASFFDPEWMFGVKDGFDVVIANPPYVEAKKLKFIASTLKPLYKVYSGTADFSVYFIEKGLNMLAKGGTLMYITTNKFFNTGYGKVVRSLLLTKQIDKIVNFEQVEVFEDVLVSSVVLGVKNIIRNNFVEKFTYQRFYKLKCEEFKKEFVYGKDKLGSYPFNAMTEAEWSFADTRALSIKSRIENGHYVLSDIGGVAIYRGVTTGYNPAFIIDNDQRDDLIAMDARNAEIIKNMLQGRNVRKWYYNESDENLIFTKQGIQIERYPIIEQYLRCFYDDLRPREEGESAGHGRKPGSYLWYEIQDNTAYYQEFERPEKIIWGLTADKWAYTLDTEGHYLPSNGYILTSTVIPIKYILGILNSKVLHYYFGFIGVMTAGGAYTLKAATISALPFVISEHMDTVIEIVDRILAVKDENHDADVSQDENLLNHLVYHLYNLTYDEVLIIDPETPITREEYENFKLE